MGNLIWLASYPKSGNTWLRAFMHNFLRDPAEPHDIDALADFTAGENMAALYKPYDPRPASEYSIADVQRMRPAVHRDLTGAFPDLVMVKTHNAVVKVEGVPLLTPEVTAGAVYILRDPRDVVISYSHHLGWSIDRTIEFMADEAAATGGTDARVYERHSSWSTHVQSWTWNLDPAMRILRYEDMLARPAETFGKVLRFLGFDPDPDRIGRAIRFSAFEILQGQERRHGFIERSEHTEGFFRFGTAGHWRRILTTAQTARIERDHARQMRRFGYL
ncbi:MAG TPA: sulfotransferase domain-containing protein [Stellaceae bacterium]|nr:sulfotransferase domain-containing protein [Stellaceae bacterium]